jgi:hypothetical protein
MLWPLVLPFHITFWCLAALVAIATAVAPALRWKRRRTFLIAVFVACVTLIPSCAGIMAIIDTHRFGVFEYDTFAEVKDFRVERYLPPTATAITIEKRPQGFRARFSIAEGDLMAYLDDLWRQYGDKSIVKRGEMASMSVVDHESHELQFGDLGWPPLDGAMEYHSPTAENGAGFFVWYSPKRRIAYQRAGYW